MIEVQKEILGVLINLPAEQLPEVLDTLRRIEAGYQVTAGGTQVNIVLRLANGDDWNIGNAIRSGRLMLETNGQMVDVIAWEVVK